MIKVLFVCLGNICRSPMAQFVFQDLVNKKDLKDKIFIDSAGTSHENELYQIGIHYETKNVLKKNNIPFEEHISRGLTKEDYDNFDYIIGMDSKNINGILRIVENDKYRKVYRLLDFTEEYRDVLDPWYYGNFDKTYIDIKNGCEKFLEFLEQNNLI